MVSGLHQQASQASRESAPIPALIRPLLSLQRLSLDEKRAQVGYRYGKEAREMKRMDYLEFIARVTSHIPD
jgi:hypothetical protein